MDPTLSKLITIIGGRKFLVFLAATGLLIAKCIDQSTWLLVCGIYVGGNIAATLANKVSNVTVGGK